MPAAGDNHGALRAGVHSRRFGLFNHTDISTL
jgi:hypothetical protein